MAKLRVVAPSVPPFPSVCRTAALAEKTATTFSLAPNRTAWKSSGNRFHPARSQARVTALPPFRCGEFSLESPADRRKRRSSPTPFGQVAGRERAFKRHSRLFGVQRKLSGKSGEILAVSEFQPSDDLLSIRRGTIPSNGEIMAKTLAIQSRASTEVSGAPVSVELCRWAACANLPQSDRKKAPRATGMVLPETVMQPTPAACRTARTCKRLGRPISSPCQSVTSAPESAKPCSTIQAMAGPAAEPVAGSSPALHCIRARQVDLFKLSVAAAWLSSGAMQ